MSDLIREVVSIQGESIEFFAIIYLENGINPKAMLLARFASEEGLLGCQSNSSIEDLTDRVHGIGRQLAFLYDCDMDVRSISDQFDIRGYVHLLVQIQQQWEEQKSRQRAAVICLN